MSANSQIESSKPELRSKSQRYADLVFTNVQHHVDEVGEADKQAKKYKALCKRSGGVLRTVGLLQFLVFLKAKGSGNEAHHLFLLQHLAKELRALNLVANEDIDNLISEVKDNNLSGYMRMTREALKLLQWHKRTAEMLISGNVELDE